MRATTRPQCHDFAFQGRLPTPDLRPGALQGPPHKGMVWARGYERDARDCLVGGGQLEPVQRATCREPGAEPPLLGYQQINSRVPGQRRLEAVRFAERRCAAARHPKSLFWPGQTDDVFARLARPAYAFLAVCPNSAGIGAAFDPNQRRGSILMCPASPETKKHRREGSRQPAPPFLQNGNTSHGRVQAAPPPRQKRR